MFKNTLGVILCLVAFAGFSQENSNNNQFNKSWQLNSTWVDNSAPSTTNVGNSGVNFNIDGYVRVGSSSTPLDLTFEGGHPTLVFTVRDTLVVYGNMNFGTDAMTLSVPAGGLLIVFGTLDVNNKVDIANGGNIVVTGQFKLTGAQADVTVAGAGTFFAGSYNPGASGEVPDTAEKNAGSDLQAALPYVYNFVNGNGVTPLPVELMFFNAKSNKSAVQLSWATASELNFDHFNLERSTDGRKFELLETIKGNGTTKERHDYSYLDESPLIGNSYYRLQSVDFDGYTETFKVVSVNFEGAKDIDLYPNPVTDSNLNFRLNFEPTSEIMVTITSATGAEKMKEVIKTHFRDMKVNLTLEPGVYVIKMASIDFNKVSRIVVK